jgi:hypothetical protein
VARNDAGFLVDAAGATQRKPAGPVWLNYDRELAWICAKILLPGDIFDSR